MPAHAAPASSGLEAVIADEIRARGPISVARFIEQALQHPTLGYYRRRQPFGAHGDFVSAPEMSQMFGELVGAWLAQAWADLGGPAPVRLVELGPGRGTMMADMLRTINHAPDLRAAVAIHLVETSGRLRATQREHLAGEEVHWHDDLAAVPPGPMLLVANEFFDALPVHQLVLTGHGWRERRVGLGPAGEFAYILADAPDALAVQIPEAAEAPPGAVAEVSPARAALAGEIGARLERDGGIALIVDYGAWAEGPTGDTLQAVRAHGACDPLAAPGLADLSTQVDFRALALAACAGGAAVFGPVPQGTFLRTLGIEARALALMSRAAPGQRREIRSALFRLTDAAAMGELFKVLALASPHAASPPGFAAPTLAP